jgi:hypothetical protein
LGQQSRPSDVFAMQGYTELYLNERWVFFEHLEKCYPHLFSEQLPVLLGDMQRDLSRA